MLLTSKPPHKMDKFYKQRLITTSRYFLYLLWLKRFLNESSYRRYMYAFNTKKKRLNYKKVRKDIFTINNSLRYVSVIGAKYREGLVHMQKVPTMVQETPEFIVINLHPDNDFTSGCLPELIFPLPPDNKGVIIRNTFVPVLDTYLGIEYSKVAPWVAMAMNNVATVVFSVVDQYPIGRTFPI